MYFPFDKVLEEIPSAICVEMIQLGCFNSSMSLPLMDNVEFDRKTLQSYLKLGYSHIKLKIYHGKGSSLTGDFLIEQLVNSKLKLDVPCYKLINNDLQMQYNSISNLFVPFVEIGTFDFKEKLLSIKKNDPLKFEGYRINKFI